MTRTGREDGKVRAKRTARQASLASGSDHEKAVLRAEVQRLVKASSPYGVRAAAVSTGRSRSVPE